MGRFEELEKPWMKDMADAEAGKEVDYEHFRYRYAEAQAALDDFKDEGEEMGAYFAERARDKVVKEAAGTAKRINESFDSKRELAIDAVQALFTFEQEHPGDHEGKETLAQEHTRLLINAGKAIEQFRIFRQKKSGSPQALDFEQVWNEIVDALEKPETAVSAAS